MTFRHSYMGFVSCHEEAAEPFMTQILQEFKPELIVELGTGWGGFTLLMHNSVPDAEMHTFDIRSLFKRKDQLHRLEHFHGKLTAYEEDVIGMDTDPIAGTKQMDDIRKDPLAFEKPNQKVIDLLQRKEKKFLFCDNGEKIGEFKMYSKYINKGDLIGVHDFGSKEINYKDIQEDLKDFASFKTWNDFYKDKGFSSRFWVKIK